MENESSIVKETVQNNIRIYADDKDAFATYCKEHELKQADAFAAALRSLELDTTKQLVPGRASEIGEVKKAIDLILSKYTDSIRYCDEAENRIRADFEARLASKDATILSLQNDLSNAKIEEEVSHEEAKAALEAQKHAENLAKAAIEAKLAAEATANDKKSIAEMLASKLAEAESKLSGFDDLKQAYADLEKKLVEEKEAAKDAARSSEKAQADSIAAIKAKNQQIIDTLKDELRSAQADARAAKADAITELNETIQHLRDKLDQRTEELLTIKANLPGRA